MDLFSAFSHLKSNLSFSVMTALTIEYQKSIADRSLLVQSILILSQNSVMKRLCRVHYTTSDKDVSYSSLSAN